MKKTGAVERRGSRHRLHYEVRCDDCKRVKWVREDTLPAVCAYCADAKGRRPDGHDKDLRTAKWYVRMVGSAHTLPQWAAGPPDAPCWTGGTKIQFVGQEPRDVPAEGSQEFDTKRAACNWIAERIWYLANHDRFSGKYAAVQF